MQIQNTHAGMQRQTEAGGKRKGGVSTLSNNHVKQDIEGSRSAETEG